MSDSTTIAKNTIALFIGEIIAHLLGFFITILLARYLGDAGFGVYSFAFAIAQIVMIFTDLGMSTLMIRNASRKTSLLKEYARNIFWIKVLLSLCAISGIGIVMLVIEKSSTIRLTVILATLAMILLEFSFFFRKFFNVFQHLEYEAIVKVSEKIITFILLIVLLLWKNYTVLLIISIFLIAYALTLIVALILASKLLASKSYTFELFTNKGIIDTFSKSARFYKKYKSLFLQFGMATIFSVIYFKIDTVMIFYMLISGDSAVGWYNAAYKLIDGLNFIPTLFNVAMFPAMSLLYLRNKKYLNLVFEKSVYYLLLLAIPIGFSVTLLAERVILFFYTTEYANSILALQILIWAEVFVFVNYFIGFLLNSIDRQKLFTTTIFIGLIFNVILNLLLIPIYGIYGAAFATLLTEILNFGMLYYFSMKKGYTFNILKTIYKPLVASLVVVIGIYITYFLHILLIIPTAIVLYFLALYSINGFGKNEFELFLKAVKKLRQKN